MSKRAKTFKYTLLLFFTAANVLLFLNRQFVIDWIALKNYTAPERIASIADSIQLTEKGRQIFYVHQPEILERNNFNQFCPTEEKTIVLGCYDRKNIYIFNVTDPKLNGVVEVTAAHELLHAAYDRLSSKEKQNINKLLEAQLAQITEQRILDNINEYKNKESVDLINEVHSIIATEVENINPELETYYARYFVNRKKIFNLSKNYESVFSSLKRQVSQYDADLVLRKSEIDRREKELENQITSINVWSDTLNQLRNNNKVDEYNSQVDAYNREIEKYRSNYKTLDNLITEYNNIIKLRNDLSVEQNKLIENIDSKYKNL